ncbi:MAG: YiiX/YebB-like N1pC/P60 family cysteine hydrolase [Cocleimonas sp.]
MFNNLRNWLWGTIVDWLNDIPKGNQNMQAINNFDHMVRELRPTDVILFEGRSRVSEVIKIITLSPWTHAAIYIGKVSDISDTNTLDIINQHYNGNPNEPLVIESLLGFGTIINPLSDYVDDNLRICRPDGLSTKDRDKVVDFAAEHLGMNYDIRQLLDLARFMFPYGILPRQWRSSLFQHNAGRPTNIVCSSMIARCFQSVNYPMLPLIESDNKDRLKFHKRNFRLFVPTDFDYSPYFRVLKFPAWPLAMKESYRDLPWEEETDPNERNTKYTL